MLPRLANSVKNEKRGFKPDVQIRGNSHVSSRELRKKRCVFEGVANDAVAFFPFGRRIWMKFLGFSPETSSIVIPASQVLLSKDVAQTCDDFISIPTIGKGLGLRVFFFFRGAVV